MFLVVLVSDTNGEWGGGLDISDGSSELQNGLGALVKIEGVVDGNDFVVVECCGGETSTTGVTQTNVPLAFRKIRKREEIELAVSRERDALGNIVAVVQPGFLDLTACWVHFGIPLKGTLDGIDAEDIARSCSPLLVLDQSFNATHQWLLEREVPYTGILLVSGDEFFVFKPTVHLIDDFCSLERVCRGTKFEAWFRESQTLLHRWVTFEEGSSVLEESFEEGRLEVSSKTVVFRKVNATSLHFVVCFDFCTDFNRILPRFSLSHLY